VKYTAEHTLTPTSTYRARLRFKLLKKLNIEANEYRFKVNEREIVLSAPTPECPIRDSEWLVMNAKGFASEDDARRFGHDLRSAIELSSVSSRLGIDAGRDLPTSAIGVWFKEQLEKENGKIIRNNVHGLDVFEDDPRVVIFSMSGTATVHANHDPFLMFAAELHGKDSALSDEARDLILLLNYALMRAEPVAQIVFAFSAVEMLGQTEKWTDAQKTLLAELRQFADSSQIGCKQERSEVSEAVGKSLHRLTLRQGVMRVLNRLGLIHLKTEWDRLYAERSTLVHGLAPRPGADYSDLANRAITLCGHILLKAVASEMPLADRHINTYYQIQSK
jgi:hypothetical protein